jgi:phosphatidate cytidylyltransferase
MAWEWTRLVGATRGTGLMLFVHCAAVLAAGIAAFYGFVAIAVAVIAVAAVVALVTAPRRTRRGRTLFFLGVIYVVLPVVAYIGLRQDGDYGLWCILWLLVVIWSTDTAAFFVGRTLGGPKLAPSISPKKTWSGALGGTVAAVAAGVAFAYAVGLPEPVAVGAVSVAASILGQLGDLLESGVKRRFGVKDSSNIIPGHGGVLDRLDSLIVAGSAAWIVGVARAGTEHAATGILIW